MATCRSKKVKKELLKVPEKSVLKVTASRVFSLFSVPAGKLKKEELARFIALLIQLLAPEARKGDKAAWKARIEAWRKARDNFEVFD